MNDLMMLRPARESDLPFIMDTWLKTLRVSNDLFKQIDKEAYYSNYPKVVHNLVHNCITTICCLRDDDDVILGYSCYTPTTLHWVFVKKQWRGNGIMKLLVNDDIKFISHLTKQFQKRHRSFNPFL